jgi:integrase/recombinase XerC
MSVDLIAEFEQHLRRNRRAETTVNHYVRLLRRMDREMPCGVATATKEEMEDWIFTDRRSDTTVGHYVTVLRSFGAWATGPGQRLDFCAADELPEISPDSKDIRPATEAEFAAIRRLPEPWVDLYELAGLAGLRSIEISRIRREDITEQEMRIYGKGSKWRTVPTNPDLWRRFADRPAGPLARSPTGTPLTNSQVFCRGWYHLHAAGFKVSMHQLRKRFAVAVYKESGHDIRLVQHLLGHASVATTQRYLGIDANRAAEVVARIATR